MKILSILFLVPFFLQAQVDSISIYSTEYSKTGHGYNTRIIISAKTNLRVIQHNNTNSIGQPKHFHGFAYEIELSKSESKEVFNAINGIPSCELCDTIRKADGSQIIIESDFTPAMTKVRLYTKGTLLRELKLHKTKTPILSKFLNHINKLRIEMEKIKRNPAELEQDSINSEDIQSININFRKLNQEDQLSQISYSIPKSFYSKIANFMNHGKKTDPYKTRFKNLHFNSQQFEIVIKYNKIRKIVGQVDRDNNNIRINEFYNIELNEELESVLNKIKPISNTK